MQFPVGQYLLIIQPHEDLFNKIMNIKKDFAERFECPQALYSKPHFSLIKFKQYEMPEQKIVQQFKKIINSNSAFIIELDNYGSFPTHTIYINVKTKNVVIDLIKELKSTQSLLKLDKDNKPHFITEPHITIARKLLPWQYEKTWIEFSNTNFNAKFLVNEIVLLKKKENKSYQQIAKFELKGLMKEKNETEQLSMF